ncbi:hypothetical protein SOVF_050770 [Spinacia oleracea]|nr:hypothetical protein SOVF_050770 [Spinacia oleracea]
MKVAECFVDPVKSRTKLITDYETIQEDLRNQKEKLSIVVSSIHNQANQAKNNGEKVSEEVTKWLEDAQAAKVEVDAWLTNISVMETTCGPCSNCCKRCKLSKEAIQKKKVVESLVERGKSYPQVAYPSSPKGIQLISRGAFTAFESIKESFTDIIAGLGRSSTKVIGVYGMGGIGKTTLVTEVGKVAKDTKLFDQVVFAVVSQTTDIRKIQGQLGDMLGLNFSRETEIGRAGQLKERLKYENKVLVILDDVWNTIELADIGIPYGSDHQGCKILITTRREHVCESMGCQETILLSLLQEDDALKLFIKNAGVVLNDPSLALEEVAKQVIKECHRLPLALVVVAKALRGKSLEEWKTASESLQRSRLTDIESVDLNVYACLRLSYDYLKAEATKKCFLLCSLFPEDHEIDLEELSKYAIGFGVFQDVDSFTSVKSRVQIVLKDLKSSSLLLKTDNMSNHVKMHDMVRDAALWITLQDKEPFIVPTPMEKNWARNVKLEEAMSISLLACPMNVRFPIRAQCPSLKILLFAQSKPLRLSDTCFEGLATLRVLDLTAVKYRLEMMLPSSIKCLQNLRTLLIRRWKLEGDISMIGSLNNLEILSFSGSLIFELPIQFAELSELRVLDLSGCKELAAKPESYTQVLRQLPVIEVIYMPYQTPMLTFDEDKQE